MVDIRGLSPDELNRHFTSIAKSITKDIPDSNEYNMIRPVTTQMFSHLTWFTSEICFKYLKNISDNNATGHDGISVQVLKKTWPYICNIVTDMFNRPLIEGVFPSQWKTARVILVHKGRDIKDPSNYCPISILPVLSKIFERHVGQKQLQYKLLWHGQYLMAGY